MLTFLDGLRGIDLLSVFIRMVLSCLCGATVGLERSAKNRPAGFRTHILVCLGAMVASLTGLYLYLEALMPSDISRISGQVISGLGFIGAGTIIVTKSFPSRASPPPPGCGRPVSWGWPSAAAIMNWRFWAPRSS